MLPGAYGVLYTLGIDESFVSDCWSPISFFIRVKHAQG